MLIASPDRSYLTSNASLTQLHQQRSKGPDASMTSNFKLLQAHFDDLHHTQEKSRAAALNGALLAFQKPAQGLSTSKTGTSPSQSPGAFLAASAAAGRTTPIAAIERHTPHTSDGASAATHAFSRRQQSFDLSRTGTPHYAQSESRRSSAMSLAPPPSSDGAARAKSPSNIAAVLATQRFTPRENTPAPHTTAPRSWHIDSQLFQHARQHSPQPLAEEEQQPPPGAVSGVTNWLESIHNDPPLRQRSREAVRVPSPAIVNARSRPRVSPTTASERAPPQHEVQEEMVRVSATPAHIQSPKPVRVPSVTKKLRDASFESGIYSDRSSVRRSMSSTQPPVPKKPDAVRRMSVNQAAPPPDSPQESFTTPPLFPQSSASPEPAADEPVHDPRMPSWKPAPPPSRRRSTVKSPVAPTGLGLTHPSSHIATGAQPRQAKRTASRDTVSTIITAPSPPSQTHGNLAAAAAAMQPPFSQRRISPHMTGDSLANAIVASSLASSRAPSPTKIQTERPHLPRHSSERSRTPFSHFKQQVTGESRTSSPVHYTMRKQTTPDEENAPWMSLKPSRNFLGMRQHPNKHREGDRKRWRGELSEVERKRYEGVWAANRGLLLDRIEDAANLPAETLNGSVANVTVRDIWSRSRLPAYVLEEVWSLVDRSQTGRLDREEFVVGLWLIDQRLMGKKLPVRVGDSVWRSVRGIQGLRIPSYKKT